MSHTCRSFTLTQIVVSLPHLCSVDWPIGCHMEEHRSECAVGWQCLAA